MATKPHNYTLFVIITALLIDLLAFTIILPLFPRLLRFYDLQEVDDSFYRKVQNLIISVRRLVSNESRLDIILFGGLVGSMYSFLQFISSPFIGRLSDKYGRRQVLLLSMVGNAISMLLWIFADSFEIFLISRIVYEGLTEGNVQMSIAMISDITDAGSRSKALFVKSEVHYQSKYETVSKTYNQSNGVLTIQALVGIAFSVGFTTGPPLGAYLASIDLKQYFPSLPINSFSSPALFALILILIETLYMYLYLPETLERTEKNIQDQDPISNFLTPLSLIHFLFLLVFSGMEFTLTFLTFDRFGFSNVDQGKLLGFMGILTALIQGGYVRRKSGVERKLVLQGIWACAAGLGVIGVLAVDSVKYLYFGVALLSITTGTVSTSLTSIAASEGKNRSGEALGGFRAVGQLGRCLGPLVACSIYWVFGSVKAYTGYAIAMGGVGVLAGFILPDAAKLKKE